MDRLPKWVRWVILIPATIISFMLVKLINYFTLVVALGSTTGFYFDAINVFIENTVAVAVALYAVYFIAPNNKNTSLITASILIGSICVFSVALRLSNSYMSVPMWKVILSTLLSIGTCIYVCVTLFKEKKNVQM